MKVVVEKLPSSEAVLEIDFTWDELERASEKAYRKLAKTIDVKGFRQGRAPRALIEAKLGKEYIYQEGLDDLMTEAYRSALKEHELIPLTQPELDAPPFEWGQPYHFSLKVPILSPAIPGDYHSLHFDQEEAIITDEEITQELETLRERQRTWQVVDRSAELGDRVTANLKLTVEGMIVSDLKDNPFELVSERSGLFSGMDMYIVGIPTGGRKTFTTKIPENYTNARLAGKEARYEVTLHLVEAKEAIELDDAFAAKASDGKFPSLERLRESLRDELLENKKRRIRDELREKVLNALIEQAQFALHPVLVQEEAEEMLSQMSRILAQQQMSLDQYLMLTRKTREEYLEELLPDAARRVKHQLVLDEVVRREGIQVLPEEIEMLFTIYAQTGQNLPRSEEQVRALTTALLQEKALTRLVELMTYPLEKEESFQEIAHGVLIQVAALPQDTLLLSLLRRGGQQQV